MDEHVRPGADGPELRALLTRLGVGVAQPPPDLGGTMSLNLHLATLGLVLRVHGRSTSEARILALRDLRRRLAGAGLTVGEPQPLLGREVVLVDGHVAEVEAYVGGVEQPPPTWASFRWMYEAMGRLHAVTPAEVDLPPPVVATYATPATVRSWMVATSAAVAGDEEAAAMAADVRSMLDLLEATRTPDEELPAQLVHGDVRLGNVVRRISRGGGGRGRGAAAWFDFGFAARRPRIHELASSLFWIVLRPDDRGRAEDFDWRLGTAELVASYEAGGGAPLDDAERRALGPYLAAVPLYLAALASQTPDPVERIRVEAPGLRIARWVLEHPDVVAGR